MDLAEPKIIFLDTYYTVDCVHTLSNWFNIIINDQVIFKLNRELLSCLIQTIKMNSDNLPLHR